MMVDSNGDIIVRSLEDCYEIISQTGEILLLAEPENIVIMSLERYEELMSYMSDND